MPSDVLHELVFGLLSDVAGLRVVGDCDGGVGARQYPEDSIVGQHKGRGRGVICLVVEERGDHCAVPGSFEGGGCNVVLVEGSPFLRGS